MLALCPCIALNTIARVGLTKSAIEGLTKSAIKSNGISTELIDFFFSNISIPCAEVLFGWIDKPTDMANLER